jgi:GT2 family glycosyltransferase
MSGSDVVIAEETDPVTAITAALPAPAPFKGYVDLFGYDTRAGGWFFAGWTTRRDNIIQQMQSVEAQFSHGSQGQIAASLFYSRDDLSDDGVGFLIFLPSEIVTGAFFVCLRFGFEGQVEHLYPAMLAAELPERMLISKLNFILSLCEPSPEQRNVARLLEHPSSADGNGYVEYFGYHAGAGGWFLSGWVSHAWGDRQAADRILVSFEAGDVRGEAVSVLFTRTDLSEHARGVIVFVPAPQGTLGPLVALQINTDGMRTALLPSSDIKQLRESELAMRVRANLKQTKPGLQHDRFVNLLARRAYAGEDTLETLAPAAFVFVDEAIQCGADGLVLMGWMLVKPGEIRAIRVRCGEQFRVLDPNSFVRIERHDVLTEFAKYGFDDANCGFIAYLPLAVEPQERLYLEIETQRFEIAYGNIRPPSRAGMSAIKQLLSVVDPRFGDIQPAFDRVLGPAVAALNQARLAVPVGAQVVEYGRVPAQPKFSLIVPLYGRLDFAEYQIALFSTRPEFAGVEIIYVLDEPARRREAQNLFASIYERFLIPFRAVLLERNVGFAPANNAGLLYAHGEYIVYLNSDVFPGTQDWLEQLCARLEEDATLGAVGPLLLFEDGSVQHCGMYFERLAEYGDWFFCQHHDKGLRYGGGTQLQYFDSITGACIMMRRDLAVSLGGFDEIYAIGDFEDSDLCLKLRAQGYRCAVDPMVRLFHLERKSQLTGALLWRANLTAYNAWQHDRRWGRTIDELQHETTGGRG